MITAEVTTSVLGIAFLTVPVAVREYRSRKHVRDATEDAQHMAFWERMREAGREQAKDPMIAEVLRRYAERTPLGVGRHRAAQTA